MQPFRRRRVFVALSLAILLSDLSLIGFSYRSARHALEQSMHEQAERLRAGYRVALSSTLSNMLQMATFVANDAAVQEAFLAGRQAVEAEGGGPGGPAAARARGRLLDLVGPAWKRMAQEFDARQLHFHLSPGSLSFLRVHRPERFGDRMDDVRHIIVDVNADLRPRSGFETGRVYSGLRGVVPVFADRGGVPVHVGAVEVGTSFTEMFKVIDAELDVGIAALLKQDHVRDNMWGEFINEHFARINPDCECMVEATSRPGVEAVIQGHHAIDYQKPFDRFDTHLVRVDGRAFAASHWPLFDYQARGLDQPKQVGAILLWRDAQAEVEAFEDAMRTNIGIAVLGFVLLETLLYWAVRLVTERLEREVSVRTRELARANRRLEQLATIDDLTGLYNRRHFLQQLAEECERAGRSGTPLSFALLDLDHFKRVNDTYGHLSGDQVLRRVARVLSKACRTYDVPCRYGGEELALLLPGADLEQALAVAERIRETVAAAPVETEDGARIAVTVSIGVAQAPAEGGHESLIGAADRALYQAKRSGRNRVCTEADIVVGDAV